MWHAHVYCNGTVQHKDKNLYNYSCILTQAFSFVNAREFLFYILGWFIWHLKGSLVWYMFVYRTGSGKTILAALSSWTERCNILSLQYLHATKQKVIGLNLCLSLYRVNGLGNQTILEQPNQVPRHKNKFGILQLLHVVVMMCAPLLKGCLFSVLMYTTPTRTCWVTLR